MKRYWSVLLLSLAVPFAGCSADVASRSLAPGATETAPIVFRVHPREVNAINPLLFGQFMERPSWGEIGPEGALVPGTNELQPEVLRLLREMSPPLLRFPGGTDVDYMDWGDMIDNVPGRDGGRPVSTGHRDHEVTNNFGFDEFLRLAESLDSQVMLVVNLRDGLVGKKPLAEAANHAAGLVAYCNSPVDAALPAGVDNWPAVRARNGREEPYAVRYVQVGNEPWIFLDELKALSPERFEEIYVDAIVAYVEAIRAVDPAIKIVVHHLPGVTEKTHARLGDKIHYLSAHRYVGGNISKVSRDGQELSISELTPREVWLAWAALPTIDERGLSTVEVSALKLAPQLGYKVAFTEWNWKSHWGHDVTNPPLDTSLIGGIGAAGYLHALMRIGGIVEIGTQSMLVGNRWNLNAIRADPTGRAPAYYMPSGQVTMLYSQHHGNQLLEMEASGVPHYQQRLEFVGVKAGRVATIDALATGSNEAIFLHAINRSFDESYEVVLDLSEMGSVGREATHYALEGRLNDAPRAGEARQVAEIRSRRLTVEDNRVKITLPMRSVSVIEIKRR